MDAPPPPLPASSHHLLPVRVSVSNLPPVFFHKDTVRSDQGPHKPVRPHLNNYTRSDPISTSGPILRPPALGLSVCVLGRAQRSPPQCRTAVSSQCPHSWVALAHMPGQRRGAPSLGIKGGGCSVYHLRRGHDGLSLQPDFER